MATDTKIILKRSDVSTAAPNLEYLQFGELAFNYRDEKLYYRSYDVNGTTPIIKNYDFQRIVPIAKGGTGAMTAADARTNLEAAAIFSPAFLGTPSLAAAATQPTIAISTSDVAAQRALATVAYVRAEIADDAPTKTGGGASGTSWAIGITGNAATASRWVTSRSITSNNTTAGSDITFNVSLDGSVNVTPTLAINTNRVSNIQTALSLVPGTNIQAYDADLKAIADLSGTSGLLKKTAAGSWALDATTYTPTSRTVTISTGNGITGGGAAQDLSADRAWTLGLTDTGVTDATYNDNATTVTPFDVDIKGRITGTGTPVIITPAFSSITNKPTNLAGYGILDALNTSATGQIKAGSLTASSFIKSSGTSSQFLKADGSSDGTSYTPTARTLTISTDNGITGGLAAQTLVDNRSWTLGLTGQAKQLHDLASDGFFVRSTSGGTTSIVARSIAVGTGLSITHGDGVSGNPTISITAGNLTSLRDNVTNGFLARTALDTLTSRSVAVGGTGLSITHGDGVSGNPTISSNATNLNTASTIVSRDGLGGFSAGAITGSSFIVSGTVNTTITGSATGAAKALTLPNKDGTVAVLTDIPSHDSGANTTVSAAAGVVLSAITVNSLGHTTSVSSKTLLAADIPVLDTTKITTGTFDTARINNASVTGKVLTGFVAGSSVTAVAATDTILGAFQRLVPNIAAKANTASPTFTGTVTLPTGSPTTAPLQFISGTNRTSPAAGSVEYNGTNLFVTDSTLSRKTIAYTDSAITGNAATATTATRLATARTISNPAAPNNNSDINFSYSFDGNANVETNFTINTARASNIRSALGLAIGPGGIQAYDADLAAIAALADGPDTDTDVDTGFLRKTGENTWAIDPNIAPIPGEEVTTITGDVIGSSGIGDRDIVAILATANASPGTYNNSVTAITPFTVDGKGRVTSTGTAVTITPSWSSIQVNTRPTSLSGYGILDAQALNSNLTSISTFTGTSSGILQRGSTGTWTLDSTSYTPTARTLTISGATNSGVTVTPSTAQSLAADRSWSISLEAGNLTQLRDLGTNTGIIAHNGTTGGGMVTRSIVSGNTAEITITNGNGVSGNPTISLTTSNLTSLRGVTTNGFLAHTGINTITPRSIAIASGSTGLSIADGNGVLGNPTLTLSSTSSAVNNSLVARDASGNFAANSITGTNFRASQGVPSSADSSTVGYAFGADGDTGLFSPIVGSGGAANGVLGLYTNNTERIRIDSTGVGIGKNPTTALDVNGTITATAFSGNASTATTLATGRTISLTGDVTYTSPSFNGGGNVTAAATITNDAVTFAKIQKSAAAGLSVIGRSTNSAGDFAEIAAGTDGHVLRRSGTSIGWGTIVNSATTATSANTANAIVARDDGGGFHAGTIIADYLDVSGELYVGGNLTVNGTTTTLNSNNLNIDDKNITLGSVASFSSTTGNITGTTTTTTITDLSSTTGMIPGQTLTRTSGAGAFGGTTTITSIDSATAITITSTTANTAGPITFGVGGATNVTADGGGITLKGATDKTFNWVSSTAAWTSSEDLNLASGKVYEINGTSVLSATGLGSGVTSSSLTSVGTITSGTWSGSFGAVSGANLTSLTAGNLSGTIPSAVLANSSINIGTTSVTLNRSSANLALTGISSVTLPGSTSGSVQIIPVAAAGSTVLTLPATTGTVVTTGDTGTVSSTMIASNLPDTKLATISTSGKVANSATTATSAATANAIVARNASGNFSANSITASADSFINSIRIGRGAGSNTYSTVIGTDALLSNTTGADNTVMGYWSLDSNTTGSRNTAVGAFSMGQNSSGADNTAVGAYTLVANTTGFANIALGNWSLNSTTSGYNNVAVGAYSMISNTTGSGNIAVGVDALYLNTTGWSNNAFGFDALRSNTTGCRNNAFGYDALRSNTTGWWNNAFGFDALRSNTTGDNNTAVGVGALYSNTTGNWNNTFGKNALYLNTTGIGNTAVGAGALYSNTTGSYNSACGWYAGSNITTGSNNICIGDNSGAETSWNNLTSQSNWVIIGNNSTQNARCKVAWATTSDKRDKTSFAPVPHGLEFVNALKPTAYRFKKDRDSEEPQEDSAVRYGFFAQDVLELEGEHPVVIDNSNPDHLAYNESSLIPILVNAIKELSAELQSVKEELAKIK